MSDLYREKSLQKVSSPEQLDDYIKVTTPSVWVVLLALVILLIGILAWSIFGSVPAKNADGATQEINPISLIIN